MPDISPEALANMVKHMNDGHADAVAAYARHFGGYTNVTSAKIADLDVLGINVDVDCGGEHTSLRIPFDHELVDAMDGRRTLVAMFQQASS